MIVHTSEQMDAICQLKRKHFRISHDGCTIAIFADILNERFSRTMTWTRICFYKFKQSLSICFWHICIVYKRLTAKKGAISLRAVCHVWHSFRLFWVIHETNRAYVLNWWSRHYSHSRCKFNVHENYCCASNTWRKNREIWAHKGNGKGERERKR